MKASDSDTRPGRIVGPGLAKWFRVKPLGLVGFGLLVVSLSMAASAEPTRVVARIGQHEITVDEYRLFLAWHKASVARRLFAQSPAVTPAMWEDPMGETTAGMILRREALAAALEAKSRQILYLEHGLAEGISYDSFRARWADDNNKRAAAVAKGLPIYGPKQWSFENYYRHWDNEWFIRLREIVRRPNDQKPSDTAEAKDQSFEEAAAEVRTMARQRLATVPPVVDETVMASIPIL